MSPVPHPLSQSTNNCPVPGPQGPKPADWGFVPLRPSDFDCSISAPSVTGPAFTSFTSGYEPHLPGPGPSSSSFLQISWTSPTSCFLSTCNWSSASRGDNQWSLWIHASAHAWSPPDNPSLCAWALSRSPEQLRQLLPPSQVPTLRRMDMPAPPGELLLPPFLPHHRHSVPFTSPPEHADLISFFVPF